MATEKELNRHKLWIDLAERFSKESKDRSTKVGCVIVSPDDRMVSSGWNGFAEGVRHDIEERHERPLKYEYAICSETNAINNAARLGHKTLGATAYINYDPTACCGKCMSNLRNAGIVRVVGPNRPFPGKGKGLFYSVNNVTEGIIAETGIEIVKVDYIPE